MPDLDAIRQRANAATKGPWRAWNRNVGFEIQIGDELDDWGRPAQLLPEGLRTDIGRREDAEFIAHARQDVPTLLDEIERLTEMNQRLDQAAMDWHARCADVRGAAEAFEAERDEARARLDAVRAQHHKIVDQSWPDGHCDYCWDQDTEDYQPWPCDTIRALDSESTKDGK